MDHLSKNQIFHLILADIAMAMAATTLDKSYQANSDGYQPGAIRDAWLEQNSDKFLRQRVTALANAGLASLSTLSGPALLAEASRFGVPLDDATAAEIAEHFVDKRNAVLTYKR